MTNFRVDRARQIMSAFFIPDETEIISKADIKPAAGLAMTPLSDRLNEVVPHLFAPAELKNGLGETISNSGLSQLRLAETEKYPHVTFFFNGGIETPFKGESRELVASPKVATYDLQPEMSAQELLQKALSAIRAHTAEVIIINFANPDMVGHTGNLKAAIASVETIDQCVGELIKAIMATNGIMIVTADHGNCDVMWDVEKQIPHTAHTTNLVFCSFVGGDISRLSDGTLADIAPTMLDLLNITKPAEMSGKSLIEKSN
jgi:2,3-bisphosphoglycerate-independent phosphoglycerate mutase